MTECNISIARDFSRHTSPRKKDQGRNSGEKFRELLVKRLKDCDVVTVDLDGTSGIGSSFLDEAFGGLVRYEDFTANEVFRRVQIKSELDESYLVTIKECIQRSKTLVNA